MEVAALASDCDSSVVIAEILAVQLEKVEEQDAEVASRVDLTSLDLWVYLCGNDKAQA